MEKRRIERVVVLMTAKEKKEVERRAKRERMPVSAFLRELGCGNREFLSRLLYSGEEEEKKNK